LPLRPLLPLSLHLLDKRVRALGMIIHTPVRAQEAPLLLTGVMVCTTAWASALLDTLCTLSRVMGTAMMVPMVFLCSVRSGIWIAHKLSAIAVFKVTLELLCPLRRHNQLLLIQTLFLDLLADHLVSMIILTAELAVVPIATLNTTVPENVSLSTLSLAPVVMGTAMTEPTGTI